MLGRSYEDQDCSAARALEVVGERWSLLILRDAIFRGFTRFSQFEQSLQIATNMLAKRLTNFVETGLMVVRPTGPRAHDSEYVLTQRGLDFKPVVIALMEWGDRWVEPGPVVLEHSGCGGRVEVRLVCKGCGEAVLPGKLAVRARRGRPRKSGASSPHSARR